MLTFLRAKLNPSGRRRLRRSRSSDKLCFIHLRLRLRLVLREESRARKHWNKESRGSRPERDHESDGGHGRTDSGVAAAVAAAVAAGATRNSPAIVER